MAKLKKYFTPPDVSRYINDRQKELFGKEDPVSKKPLSSWMKDLDETSDRLLKMPAESVPADKRKESEVHNDQN